MTFDDNHVLLTVNCSKVVICVSIIYKLYSPLIQCYNTIIACYNSTFISLFICNRPNSTAHPSTTPGRAPGPQGVIEDLDKYWWSLWRPPSHPANTMNRWTQHLQRLSPYTDMGRLTTCRLRRALRKWSKRKDPGADRWRPGELKDFPDAALAELILFFNLVEDTGKWPDALQTSLVAMLTKGGTDDPADRRPIVLLPALQAFGRSTGCRQAGVAG